MQVDAYGVVRFRDAVRFAELRRSAGRGSGRTARELPTVEQPQRRIAHRGGRRRNGQRRHIDRLFGLIRQQTGSLMAAPAVDCLIVADPCQSFGKTPRYLALCAFPESDKAVPLAEQSRIEFNRSAIG